MAVFSKLDNALRSQIGTKGLDGETELDMRCLSCARKEKVGDWDQIKKGDHIILKGENFMMNIRGKQISPYTHHAIVKDVLPLVEGSTASVTLIHFYTTPFDMTLKIQETTELLDFSFHEIIVLRYRHQTHSADKIVKRATKIMDINAKVKYSALLCNCEHFCNLCCVSQEKSFQSDTLVSVLRDLSIELGSLLGKLLKIILRFVFVSLEDASRLATGAITVVPWGVLAATALLYLVYTFWKHHKLDESKKRGKYCATCCLRKKQELWMTFVTYCCFQVDGLGLSSFLLTVVASKGVLVGVLLLCSVLSVGFMNEVPRLRKLFGSPFEGLLFRVTNLGNVRRGHVISFDNWKVSHDAIVTSVSITPDTRNKKGRIRVVHYSLPSLFGHRTIVEEDIDVDVTQVFIKGHNYKGYKVHPPERVVERARQRLGETKFRLLSNRSCHFCHWAKMDEGEDGWDTRDDGGDTRPELLYIRDVECGETLSDWKTIHVNHQQGRVRSTSRLQKTWARIRDDVHKGTIISFKYRGLWHKAICTDVEFSKEALSKLSVTVVHYGKNCTATEEAFEFDLNNQNIWIYTCHPIYKYETNEILRRARSKIGVRNYNMLHHRSTHFVKEIALKDVDCVIKVLDEIQAGDVIVVMYWGLKHAAVVTEIKSSDNKPNTIGKIKIVHYALDSLFSTRFVKEEDVSVDLQKDMVWLKNYKGYFSYPRDVVVKRAISRVGERRFTVFGNTSWELAHWAKVLQTSAVVIQRSPSGEGEKYMMVPKLGKVYDGFQRLPATSWMDLSPGIIVEYYYYWILHQGILTGFDEKKKNIRVIHYGTSHLFATRTVMEDAIRLDLAYDSIWKYAADPRRCYKASVSVAKARERLGEQRWGRGNRSWDFCKDCVLKKISEER